MNIMPNTDDVVDDNVADDDFVDLSDEEYEKLNIEDIPSLGSTEEDVKDPEVKPEAVVTADPVVEKEAAVKETEPDVAIDYEAEYKKIMAPFKASGRLITPKNSDDAIRFLQMGGNYHDKMAGMKPALKALKALENNGLLDEEKLNFLIDLHKGNPEAVTRLLKDKQIDPLDVDVQAETTYRPANYSVSDAELQLDEVLNEIKDTPTYAKTLNIVTKEWDEKSRNEAATNPHIIGILNGQVRAGVYDTVMAAVQYDRSMGRLQGMSDLDAYKATGNRLEAEGALGTSVTSTQNTGTITPAVSTNPVKEAQRRAQKKAAGPTRTISKKIGSVPEGFNPLNMTDEEFEKFDPKTIGL